MNYQLVPQVCSFVLLITPMAGLAGEVRDDFSKSTFSGRFAERGDWEFKSRQATCVSDPKLYKEFKNHGPILKWPHEFREGTIEFEMRPQNCQRVVFTLNGDGHVFRVTLADETEHSVSGPSKVPTRLIAWATKSSKQNKGDTIKPSEMPDLSLLNGQWVKVRLEIDGEQAVLRIGDFLAKIDHPALARDKSMVMITFAFGELAIRDFRLQTP